MSIWNDEPLVVNCLIYNNHATWLGGGVDCSGDTTVQFVNCIFADNDVIEWQGGAIASNISCLPHIKNCILWGNDAPVDPEINGPAVVTYSNIAGGYPGTGNINSDPLFANPGTGDFRLSPDSPCIDAGDNTAVPPGILTDLEGLPRFVDDPATPDTGVGPPPVVDMGAYEFQVPCLADVNGDGEVDVLDLLALLAAWGNTSGPEDINGDGIVDVLDLLELLASWGPCP
jgi:hypothetical protein